MSPIEPGSKLGRVIAIKEELIDLLHKIKTIKNALNPTSYEPLIAKVTFKLLPTTIKKINKSWTTYLQSIPVSSINEHEHQVNSTIAKIVTRGANIKNLIKNITINDLTLDFIITNLHHLNNETAMAISEVTKLVGILDIHERIALASNRSSRPVPRLPLPSLSLSPPPPPPLSAPPRLQRQPNISAQERGLVRQAVSHLSLDDQAHGSGKKYFKKRRLTHRNRVTKRVTKRNILRLQKQRKHYKTRRLH